MKTLLPKKIISLFLVIAGLTLTLGNISHGDPYHPCDDACRMRRFFYSWPIQITLQMVDEECLSCVTGNCEDRQDSQGTIENCVETNTEVGYWSITGGPICEKGKGSFVEATPDSYGSGDPTPIPTKVFICVN